jgi:2-C-methyl-D-erythritol 4-phosphate cytidylyltransferase
MRAAVIVLAAGDGRRVGAGTNKVLLPLAGLPVFAWSLRWLEEVEYADRVVVIVRDQDRSFVETVIADRFPEVDVAVVTGGRTRHASEWNALMSMESAIDAGEIDVVVIHDAARPLAGPHVFTAVIEDAAGFGGALPVREQPALVPRVSTSVASMGERLVSVQTPQAFRAQPLLDAHRMAALDGFIGPDTASCMERYTDLEICCLTCSATNLKITYPDDVAVAERLLDELDLR